MLHHKIPAWVLIGGFSLTLVAGCINSIGLISLHHQALSHMSGNLTALGVHAARAEGSLLAGTIGVMGAFFLGAFLSGYIIRQSTLQVGRRYGVALAIESALLFLAVHFLRGDARFGEYLAAMACGLQNAMASSYSGSVIRTTHVTGMITDIGIACGQCLRGQRVDIPRLRLYGTLLAGFLSGTCLGTAGYEKFGYDTLLFPAAACGACGLGYAIFKHIERRQQRRHARARTDGDLAVPSRSPASGE